MRAASDADDPPYCVTRGVEGDVIVRWSELTDAEQAAAWDFHLKTFADDHGSKS
ncbi:hypothetical protein SAMN05192541_13433 [Bradyrhizobium arachidis]|nr:hypothetical protein SAMN05192541_13433 [Bradyrhizobium arachidis]